MRLKNLNEPIENFFFSELATICLLLFDMVGQISHFAVLHLDVENTPKPLFSKIENILLNERVDICDNIGMFEMSEKIRL